MNQTVEQNLQAALRTLNENGDSVDASEGPQVLAVAGLQVASAIAVAIKNVAEAISDFTERYLQDDLEVEDDDN